MPDAKKTATLYSLVLLSLLVILTILYFSSRLFMPKIIVEKAITTEQLKEVPVVLSKMEINEDEAISLVKDIKSKDIKDALKALEDKSLSDPREKVNVFLKALLAEDFDPAVLEKLESQGDIYTKGVQIIDLLEDNKNRIGIVFPYFQSSIIEVLKKSKSENRDQEK